MKMWKIPSGWSTSRQLSTTVRQLFGLSATNIKINLVRLARRCRFRSSANTSFTKFPLFRRLIVDRFLPWCSLCFVFRRGNDKLAIVDAKKHTPGRGVFVFLCVQRCVRWLVKAAQLNDDCPVLSLLWWYFARARARAGSM